MQSKELKSPIDQRNLQIIRSTAETNHELAQWLLSPRPFPIQTKSPKGSVAQILKGGTAMSQRESNLLWLKDILEHMMHCQEQLEWTEDEETVQVLTETMLRDLESCRRLLTETARRRREVAAV